MRAPYWVFTGRSSDYSLGPVNDTIVQSHQDVADTFQRLGVLDGPAAVAPFWERSFGKALAARAAA
jgi:sulfonate transport system substrate-binding protein